MLCCPRPSASGNSASGHPQHLVGDSFDCCTERYEIVVYYKILRGCLNRFNGYLTLSASAVAQSFSFINKKKMKKMFENTNI